jgi:quercetin dioxygenase-like cupin family protein
MVALVLLIGCGGGAYEPPPAETVHDTPVADIASAGPEQVSVALENEWVRALRMTLEPGAQLPRHVGGDRVVWTLSDYTIEWAEGDEPPTEMIWTAGQAHWHVGGAHAVRNTGSSVAEFLVVERRGVELPAEAQTTSDTQAVALSPEPGPIVLENDAVRVAELTLPPGESTGRHWGGHRVVFALSDHTIRWTEGDADPVEMSWSEGEAHWHQSGDHEVENIGDSSARFLVVTFLR